MAYHTGPTFYPGGDDYHMPEVVAPAPQRYDSTAHSPSNAEAAHRVGEHPTNIEQNVASMEHQAEHSPQLSTQQSSQQGKPSSLYSPAGEHPQWSPVTPENATSQTTMTTAAPGDKPAGREHSATLIADRPNFSPFPPIPNKGSNVPPTDEEREATLESAREAVLLSDDFEMQLTWAQDALAYIEVAVQNEQRVSQTQPPRPRTPRVEHMLREDAMKVVSFLADQNHPRASFIRGTWFEFGKFGYRVDKREAFSCYTTATERGYFRGFYRIGMQFENSNDALKAIKYYQYGVDKGDAASCYRLGMMALLGQHGQPKDFHRGVQLVQTASDQADDNAPQGAYVLGMLQAGELPQVNVPESYLARDIRSAKVNVERAAFLGFAKAQTRMGAAYELGDLGCSFDAALSLHYYALAARQGEPDAEMSISKWFLCGQEGVFQKNEEMAFTYAQRAAVSGLATAQFAMGYFYEVGIYVPSDLKQAREWYQRADENGNEEARGRIAAVSRSKTISRKEHDSIALQRIRQQHANGGRPPAMTTVQESQPSNLEMPDVSRINLNSPPAHNQPGGGWPLPNGAHEAGPNFRPTSAFGINPNLRNSSTPVSPPQRHDPYRVSSAPIQPGPPPGVGYGRGRIPGQGPDSATGMASGPGPQGYGYNNRLQQQPPPPMRPNAASSNQSQGYGTSRPPPIQSGVRPPGVDIGYSAPLDPTGADRRNTARRPLPSQSQQGAPPQQMSRPPAQAQQPQQQQPGPSQAQRPPRQDSVQPARLQPSKPPRVDAPTPRPDQQRPQAVPASAAAGASSSTAPKPNKGPKTFDEMGVPQAKKESDCAVM